MSEKNLFILQDFFPNVYAEVRVIVGVQDSKWICYAVRIILESVSTNKYTAFNDLNKLKVNKWKHNSK